MRACIAIYANHNHHYLQTWIAAVDGNLCLCSHQSNQRILWRCSLLENGWKSVDSPNAAVCISAASVRLWHRFSYQLHRYLLSRIACHPLRHDARCHLHLHFRDSASHARRNDCWQKPEWSTRSSVPSERRPTAYTREKVVHGAVCDHHAGWSLALWLHLYRNVS
jgi:hypothetical protein